MSKEKVIETIKKAGKPLKGGEISELSGIDKKIVDKLIKELKTDEKIFSPKRCFYDVKK
jgi:predicted transcriptional regulator